jgi:hypothetical protein
MIKISFHANSKCLLNWNYHEKLGKRINTLPIFKNSIASHPNLKKKLSIEMQKQIDQLEMDGISIIKKLPFPIPIDHIKISNSLLFTIHSFNIYYSFIHSFIHSLFNDSCFLEYTLVDIFEFITKYGIHVDMNQCKQIIKELKKNENNVQ